MKLSTESQILIIIKEAERGYAFFTEDFVSIANAKTVSKALEN